MSVDPSSGDSESVQLGDYREILRASLVGLVLSGLYLYWTRHDPEAPMWMKGTAGLLFAAGVAGLVVATISFVRRDRRA